MRFTLDPVPYLDILGIAEGCILLVCASMPTLGPLVRFTKRKFGGTLDASRERSYNMGESAQNTSGSGRGGWTDLKGSELGDPEHGSSGMHSSVDDIPLVQSTSMRDPGQRSNDVHKTAQFSAAEDKTTRS